MKQKLDATEDMAPKDSEHPLAPIEDPEAWLTDLVKLYQKSEKDDFYDRLANALGTTAEKLSALNSMWDVRKSGDVEYTDKILDEALGKTHRRIVVVNHIPPANWLYMNFVFKTSRDAWRLTFFNFETETTKLMPEL